MTCEETLKELQQLNLGKRKHVKEWNYNIQMHKHSY